MRLHGCFIIVSGIRVRHGVRVVDIGCIPDRVVNAVGSVVDVVPALIDLKLMQLVVPVSNYGFERTFGTGWACLVSMDLTTLLW